MLTGISPGTAITGFASNIAASLPESATYFHSADTAAADGIFDLLTAFENAAGRTDCPIIVTPLDLGGMTLLPGLYKSGSTFAITGSDLTLEGTCDSAGENCGDDDGGVWIFQMASSFSMAENIKVTLTNGAKAENIFWQVKTAVSLGKTTTIHGTIMAGTAITVATGATVNGRVLAMSAANLNGNAINVPPVTLASSRTV
jgi:hypothetical protein